MNPLEERFEILIDGLADRGYGIVDHFLSPEETAALARILHEKRRQGEFKPAGIGNQQVTVQTGIRGDSILWLAEEYAAPEERAFLSSIRHFIDYLNRTCYLNLRDAEFHYAHYPAGTFYQRHLDRFRTDSRRRLSVICYLNDDWQPADGGQLLLYLPQENGTEQALEVLPVGGRLVCFESARLEHEVLPAGRDRISLTGWLRTA
ncbi:2OG-Fe(II) oxygenase [Larkinella soli]|uniref:2OG-Fe(II) oxygenase n=1 Tax=Larkinella soli TaxID=1770527 RepID=UPI00286E73BA|nr:2OG-Fe(II) oxygenase [Larkinella soli]